MRRLGALITWLILVVASRAVHRPLMIQFNPVQRSLLGSLIFVRIFLLGSMSLLQNSFGVSPAEAGIQPFQPFQPLLDPDFRPG